MADSFYGPEDMAEYYRMTKPNIQPNYPVSHICSICGSYEYPESDIAVTMTWLCPECVSRIKRMIYRAEKDDVE